MSTLSWQVLHGHGGADGRGANWEGLLPDKKINGDTLHPELRAEILKYGELAQATYDGFYGDPKDTAHFGKNRFKLEELLNTSLPKYSKAHGYKPVKYLWATSGVHNITADALIPSWRQMAREAFRANKVHLNMAGFIAHSPPTQDGTIDVVIAWRGTLVPDEWASNLLGGGMKDWEGPAYKTDKVQVHTGFFDIYTNSLVKYQQPPKQDIHLALDRLLLTYKVRSITTTGHSLGGALAILSAAEIAQFLAQRPTGAEDKILVPDPEDLTRLHEKTVIRPLVSCFAYAPPQPGNKEFLDLLREMKVPVLRVTNEKGGDIVPLVPNVVGAWQRGKPLQAVAAAAGDAAQAVHHGGGYQAAGVPLQLDSNLSTIVNKKDRTNWLHPVQHLMEIFGRSHNLELYLWLLATQYGGQKEPEGPDSPLDPGDRDWALLNKSDAVLRDEFNTPGGWWADPRHKGLVKDWDGRWRKA